MPTQRGVILYRDRHGAERRVMVDAWSFDSTTQVLTVVLTDGSAGYLRAPGRWQFRPLRVERRVPSLTVPFDRLDASARRALLEVVS